MIELENEYGLYKLIKQVPSAEWGDIKRVNRITNKEVTIHDYSQLFTIKFDKPVPLLSTIERFEKLKEVEYVHQPITIVFHTDPPNDQYYTQNDQWYLHAISAEGAWDITTGSNNVKIGIIDYGTDQDHPDLETKIDGGDGVEYTNVNGSNVYHGTWVAGVAGAKTNNSIGIASLGWNIKLNTYGSELPPDGSTSFVISDIVSASLVSDILNFSFGTFREATLLDITETHPNCPRPDKWVGEYVPHSYPEIHNAIIDAYQQGVICIAAAGNKSQNDDFSMPPDPELCDPCAVPFINYPAAYSEVIAVSGTTELDNFRTDYNYGNFVNVSGPSQNIKTTNFGGGYVSKNGTSFASPLVSAMVGLIKSLNSGLSFNQIKDIITKTADKVGQYSYNSSGWNQYMGYGRINAHNALNVTNGKPHKPQYIKVAHYGGITGHPKITWFTNPNHPINSKFNTKRYKVYRSYEDNGYRSPWQYISTVSHNSSISEHYYVDNQVTTYRIPQSSTEWFYRVIAFSDYSNYESIPSDEDFVYGDGPIGKRNVNNDQIQLVNEYKLFNNYPNPFNPSTILSYSVPEESIVNIRIYDILGAELITLVNEKKAIGLYSVEFNASNLSGGVYFYHMDAISTKNSENYFSETKRMLLIK